MLKNVYFTHMLKNVYFPCPARCLDKLKLWVYGLKAISPEPERMENVF